MNKLNISYIVIKNMPLGGGIEKYTEEIGWRLAKRGHRITVYAMRHYGTKDGRYRDMTIKTVPTLKTRSLEKIIASFTAALRQIFERDSDIVHFHAFGPSMFCFIPRLMGRKVLVQGHGIEWRRSKWGIVGRIFLRLTEIPSILFPHALSVVSKVQKDYIKRNFHRDSVYIPTGVNSTAKAAPDLIRSYGLSGDDYILFAGRLVREKGVHHLIRAFKNIGTNHKLVIAGDALHEDAYKRELHLIAQDDPRICFVGFVTGKLLRELYSNCSVFVLPSEIEGLPTALLEAMSYGTCCLVSDIPENREALNGLGYSYQSHNVDDLREKLAMLLADQETRERFKEGAKDHVYRNHSWEEIADQFEQLYYKIIQGKTSKQYETNH